MEGRAQAGPRAAVYPPHADYPRHFGAHKCLAVLILSLLLGPNDTEPGEGTRIVEESVGGG